MKSLHEVYQDLHRNPELSHAETRTAAIAAAALRTAGYEVHEGVGGTGVVGVLHRGGGPTVYLRADMDALPVAELTGLDYASSATGVKDGAEVPVMHACGHDMHVTAMIGASAQLAAEQDWSGRLVIVFQPAEETGDGADGMVADGLYTLAGKPDVVLGQHVGPIPAGLVALHAGPAFAAYDGLKITLYGRGGHGSRPEATVDPVLMAAALIQRLQGIVAREVAGTETAVLSVGAVHAGSTAANVIPDQAELWLTVRTFDPGVRNRVLAAIERITAAEAAASGADRAPTVVSTEAFPPLVNDPAATETVRAAFASQLPQVGIVDPGLVTGSEDVGRLAEAAGAPTAYWILGGADPQLFAGATTGEQLMAVSQSLPSNHSPRYAPVIEPTLSIGIAALVAAAHAWLAG